MFSNLKKRTRYDIGIGQEQGDPHDAIKTAEGYLGKAVFVYIINMKL